MTTVRTIDTSDPARTAASRTGGSPRREPGAGPGHPAHPLTLVGLVLLWWSALSLAAVDVQGQLSSPTYTGSVSTWAFPSANPNCTTPPQTCASSKSLTTPGTVSTSGPGTPAARAQLTFAASGPSVMALAASLPMGAEWDRGISRAQGGIDYSVEIVGPPGAVPMLISASGAVSASNGFYMGPIGGTAASVDLTVDGVMIACAASPFPAVACSAQESFSGVFSRSVAANTPIPVRISALAWTYSLAYTGIYTAYIDPVFSVDPSFPNAASYTVVVSPGVTQSWSLLFGDSFEGGDLITWSTSIQ